MPIDSSVWPYIREFLVENRFLVYSYLLLGSYQKGFLNFWLLQTNNFFKHHYILHVLILCIVKASWNLEVKSWQHSKRDLFYAQEWIIWSMYSRFVICKKLQITLQTKTNKVTKFQKIYLCKSLAQGRPSHIFLNRISKQWENSPETVVFTQ